MTSTRLPAAEAQHLDDCWNRIGVWGDKQCELLASVVHCRNCPVYAAAARQILDRVPPRGSDSMTALEQDRPETRTIGADAKYQSVLVFRVQDEWLALPSRVLDEVAHTRPIHTLPHHRAGALLGLTNVRGTLLVCVSLTALLGLAVSARPAPGRSAAGRAFVLGRVLVLNTQGASVAMPVDEVQGVMAIASDELMPLPSTVALSRSNYANGVVQHGERSIGILDEIRLTAAIVRSLT